MIFNQVFAGIQDRAPEEIATQGQLIRNPPEEIFSKRSYVTLTEQLRRYDGQSGADVSYTKQSPEFTHRKVSPTSYGRSVIFQQVEFGITHFGLRPKWRDFPDHQATACSRDDMWTTRAAQLNYSLFPTHSVLRYILDRLSLNWLAEISGSVNFILTTTHAFPPRVVIVTNGSS